MELDLGLALSSTIRSFDLNCYSYEASNKIPAVKNKKRSFNQAFDPHNLTNAAADGGRRTVPRTLPLLVWNNQPNEDPNNHNHRRSPCTEPIDDGEVIVGWPPVKSMWRKNKKKKKINRTAEIEYCSSTDSNSNSMFVKVKMDGVAIARKIDLSLYDSLRELEDTLINMFGKCHEDFDCYKLTYQNSEGDWLLAKDVSWRTFIRSVQRLKLIRSNNILSSFRSQISVENSWFNL